MNIETIRDQGLLIFEGIVGPRLYGTHKEDSINELLGVYVLPNGHILAGKASDTIYVKDEVARVNGSYFELRTFLKMLAAGSPAAIETLFIPKQFILYKNEVFDFILEQKREFISINCKFSFGYTASRLYETVTLHNTLNLAKDHLDFFKVLPDGHNKEPVTFSEYNKKVYIKTDQMEPELVRLVPVKGFENMYSVYYSYKLHCYQTREIFTATALTGMTPNEDGELTTMTHAEMLKNESEFPFAFRVNVIFDKKGYLSYKALVKRKAKLLDQNYRNKTLAEAYRLFSYGTRLAENREIHFDLGILAQEFESGRIKPQNIDIIFENCKKRLEQAYSNIKTCINREELYNLEVRLRSAAELLRTLNKEQVVDS